MPTRLPMFFVLLLLSGLLLAAAGTQGAVAGPLASSSSLEDDFEALEEDLEEEENEEEAAESECETAREEAAEGELGPVEVDEICVEVTEVGKKSKDAEKQTPASDSVAPQECLLRSAHSHAAVNAAGNKLKLTIGYTAYEPVAATVEVRKGSSRIARKSLKLGRSGVLRIVKDLSKAKAPKLVVVSVSVATSPGYCGKYETEKVRVR